MIVHNERVTHERFATWHRILVATGGRYVRDPRDCGDHLRIDYEPGDYVEQQKRCHDMFTPIRELRRDQWWRRMLRRFVPKSRGDAS